jgi:hypothetical protein
MMQIFPFRRDFCDPVPARRPEEIFVTGEDTSDCKLDKSKRVAFMKATLLL